MSFLSANAFTFTLTLLFLVIMDIHPSLSFVPSTATINSRKKHVISQGHTATLIPSQVLRRVQTESPSSMGSTTPSLVPSQVLKASLQLNRQVEKSKETKPAMSASNVTASVTSFSNAEFRSVASKSKRSRRRTARRKHMMKTTSADDEKRAGAGTNIAIRNKRILMGDLPDIHWRAVPTEHLRFHPRFVPLPPPEMIDSLETLEDVRNFRQDSWQWDALHEGRCTTSQAAAALGLLEPEAGHALNIPASWRRGGTSAFYRLREKALHTLEEMNAVLCEGIPSRRTSPWHPKTEKGPFWVTPSVGKASNPYPFTAKYLVKVTPEERRHRRQKAEQYAANGMFMSVRMSWGAAQEATSILTALNYFCKNEPGTYLKEAGMCGAGLSSNQTNSEFSVLVGASPDAIICHPNGTVEALEVKNHCPFVPATYFDKDGTTNQRYAVRQMPFRNPTVPPLYVPQLMMEMLCVGPECRSAVMVRQTATNGAVIMRIHRDDEWIAEMMFWLNRFQREFVEKNEPPPKDFFWNDQGLGDRYKAFIERTKEISTMVDVLQYVKHHEVQRVLSTSRNITSLFLD